MSQLLGKGGYFPITASGNEMGRITFANDFSPTTGGNVTFTVNPCAGAPIHHRLGLRLNNAHRWQLFNAATPIRTVLIDGPVITRKCMTGVRFR